MNRVSILCVVFTILVATEGSDAAWLRNSRKLVEGSAEVKSPGVKHIPPLAESKLNNSQLDSGKPKVVEPKVEENGSHVKTPEEQGSGVNVPGTKVDEKGSVNKVPETKVEEKGSGVKVPDTNVDVKGSVVKTPDSKVEEKGSNLKALEPKVNEKGSEVKTPDTKVDEKGSEVKSPDTKVDEKGEKGKSPDTKVNEKGAEVKSPDTKVDEKGAEVKSPDTKVDEKGVEVKSPDTKVNEKGAEVKVPEAKVTQPKTGGIVDKAEDCTGVSNRCTKQKLTTCLRSGENGSNKLVIIVQNVGDTPLQVDVSAPDSVKLSSKQLEVSKHEVKKINASVNVGESSAIEIKAGSESCILHVGVPTSEGNLSQWMMTPYTDFLTPIYGAYFVFALSLTVGGTWACCRFVKRRRHGNSGVPYQELEMGLPVSSSAANVETADGWDEGWDSDWDEERAVRSPGHRVGNVSANGLTARSPSKDGWENDWDE